MAVPKLKYKNTIKDPQCFKGYGWFMSVVGNMIGKIWYSYYEYDTIKLYIYFVYHKALIPIFHTSFLATK